MNSRSSRFRGFEKPVIILGAPRSGTSLLHRILRGVSGSVSLAKESEHIWQRYTHPAKFGWEGEGYDLTKVDEAERRRLHRLFARYALPAATWRQADQHNVLRYQRNPLLSTLVLRPAYHALAFARTWRVGETLRYRLVEKSVSSGLWLPLVDHIFPDARYVHIVRDPRRTIESMIAGWQNPDRFFTYRVPAQLRIPDYADSRWNFALPTGWRGFTSRPLAEIACFQWAALQSRIMEFARAHPQRYLRVRLEDLTSRPRPELERIAGFLDLEWDSHLEEFARAVPVVNGRDHLPPKNADAPADEIAQFLGGAGQLVDAFGYRV